jgi:hypothetical protein
LWDQVPKAESYVVEIESDRFYYDNQTWQKEGIAETYYIDTRMYDDVGYEAKYRVKAVSSKRPDSEWSEQKIGYRSYGSEMYDEGDTGPGGGIIVYRYIDRFSGWRDVYLEASPAYTEQTADWGLNSISYNFETSLDIGGGMDNTILINQRLEYAGETGKAAQVARALDINGCNDWFLPSLEEFDLMLGWREELSLKAPHYWSSSTGWLINTSPSELNKTWYCQTENGDWYVTTFESSKVQRSSKLAVRAMRSFYHREE